MRSDRARWPRSPASLAMIASLTLGACTGLIGDREIDKAPFVDDPAPATLHRLTRAQYENAIHDLLGDEIAVPTALEPDVEVEGFATVGGSVGSVSRRGVEQYETAALKVAEQAMMPGPARDALVGCTPAGTTDPACAKSFLAGFGRRAWRRALTTEEVERLAGLASKAAETLVNFYDGLGFAIAAMLEAPSFLYRAELGAPDPSHPGVRRYTGYEMASRLAFFLWNTTPDDALLDAAERGDLDDDAGLENEIDRMLDSPRAHEAFRNFWSERLGLAQLDDLSKDSLVFPAMSADLGPSAREETLALVDQLLFEEDRDYRELFTTRRTFVDRKLASLYGVPAPSLDELGEVTLPEKGLRRGLLGHASILTLYAHPTSSSATLRGKFVRKTLLCGVIPAPPANVNTALPDPSMSGPTLRDRLTVHLTEPFCASCHKPMDFIGLGLENFDGLGQLRLDENGAPIDASGTLDGEPFSDPAELGATVAAHPDLGACLTRHLLRYASAAPETSGEEAEIARIAYQFADQGYRVSFLLRAIARSPAFRTASESP